MHQALGFGRAVGGGAVETIVGTANQITVSSATGDVTLSIPAVFIAPGSIQATTTISATSGTFSTLTAGRVPFASTGGLLIDDADMTFATDTLTVTKLIGSTSITDSGLTAGRVTFASTGGLLADSSAFTFSAGALTIGGNLTFGTAGSILSGTTGSQGITVTGTNENWTTTIPGSGIFGVTNAGTTNQLNIANMFQAGVVAGAGRGPYMALGVGAATNNSLVYQFVYAGGTGSASNYGTLGIFGGTTALSVFGTGHTLLGGLTTDGTGVLQFPAAITSAGGIALGTDTFLFRNGTSALTLDLSGSRGFLFDKGAAGSNERLQTTSGSLSIVPTVTFTSAISVPGAANAMITSSSTFTSGAAAQLGTLTNAPTAGNPTSWIKINDNGTTRYIPAW